MAKPRRQTPIYENFCSRLSGVFISVSKNPPPFQRSRLVGISLGTTTNRHTRTSRASINTSLTSSRPVPCFVYGRVCLARTVKTVLPNNNECVGGWTGRIARRVPLSRVFLTQFRSSGSFPPLPPSLSLSLLPLPATLTGRKLIAWATAERRSRFIFQLGSPRPEIVPESFERTAAAFGTGIVSRDDEEKVKVRIFVLIRSILPPNSSNEIQE